MADSSSNRLDSLLIKRHRNNKGVMTGWMMVNNMELIWVMGLHQNNEKQETILKLKSW